MDGAPPEEERTVRKQARALSRHRAASEAFDLDREDPDLRSRYGRHTLGQSCLLARRLVERGVRAVLVRSKGWDDHQNIMNALTTGFPPKLPALDQAVGALFEDLRKRGLLENTVVWLASEFGRTPRLNPSGGRDHWPRAHSTLLFGGNAASGVVVGETDARGEEPRTDPVSPADVFATVVAALDLDLDHSMTTPDGRPIMRTAEGASRIAQALRS